MTLTLGVGVYVESMVERNPRGARCYNTEKARAREIRERRAQREKENESKRRIYIGVHPKGAYRA